MRGNFWIEGARFAGLGCLVAVAVAGTGRASGLPVATGACRQGVLEGEVLAGQSFTKPIGNGLEVRLEALSWGSGWLLRIRPVRGPQPSHDYAELATPPYASVNPLLLSTDYSFRSQDAVAWNPRHFRFAATTSQYLQLAGIFERYSRTTPPPAGSESDLAAAVSKTAEGTLQILDAKLVPGTANQAQMAAVVASHFSTTAHTVEEAAAGREGPLGKLTWIRFRLSLDLPQGFRAGPGLTIKVQKCS